LPDISQALLICGAKTASVVNEQVEGRVNRGKFLACLASIPLFNAEILQPSQITNSKSKKFKKN